MFSSKLPKIVGLGQVILGQVRLGQKFFFAAMTPNFTSIVYLCLLNTKMASVCRKNEQFFIYRKCPYPFLHIYSKSAKSQKLLVFRSNQGRFRTQQARLHRNTEITAQKNVQLKNHQKTRVQVRSSQVRNFFLLL